MADTKRYSVFSRASSVSIDEIARICDAVGAAKIKKHSLIGQVMCNLTPDQKQAIENKNVVVKEIKSARSLDRIRIEAPPSSRVSTLSAGLNLYTVYGGMREAYSPTLNGILIFLAIY